MFYAKAAASSSASASAVALYGLLLTATGAHCQDANAAAKAALSRSYPIEQVAIRSGVGLVTADAERAIALGRHKDQTPQKEYVNSQAAKTFVASTSSSPVTTSSDDDVEAENDEGDEEGDCGEDEEWVPYGNSKRQVGTNGIDVELTNDITAYLIKIGVGEPAQEFPRLLIDTGSANTWVNNSVRYVPTSTSKFTGDQVGVNYGIGYFRGDEYTDTVSLVATNGEILEAKNQGIGIATNTSQYDGLDGLLALAPKAQTFMSLKNAQGEYTGEIIPTVVDTLFAQGEIPENVFALSLVPKVASQADNGLVTFGGVEPSQFNGPIQWFPKAQGDPVKYYWGFDITSVKLDIRENDSTNTYQSLELLPNPAQGVTDSASTLVGLGADTFQAYYNAIDGAEILPGGSELLIFPQDQIERLGNMTFTIGGQDFLFPPAAQVFPMEIASLILGPKFMTSGLALSVFSNTRYIGQDSFTLGMYFLERYYSVYDTTNSRIGFATTEYTFEDTFHENTNTRRTKRAHRDHEKKHEWVDGKSRMGLLKARSPFRAAGKA